MLGRCSKLLASTTVITSQVFSELDVKEELQLYKNDLVQSAADSGCRLSAASLKGITSGPVSKRNA